QEEKFREWKKIGVNGAVQVRENFSLAVTGLSLGIMLFAGLTPSISIKAIADPIEKWLYKDSVAGESGLESSSGEVSFNQELYTIERFTGLPRQKLIGSGPELAKRIVMIVQFPTTSFVKSDLPNTARYWRSYSYDQYTGTGWQSSPTVEVGYRPGQEISSVYNGSFDIITQEIRLSNALRGSLYSAGAPLTLDHDVLVSWRTVLEESQNGNSLIVGMEDIFAVTLDQIIYQVRSLISTASDDELRLADDAYPDWVTERFLDLPDTVPPRVKNLAGEIIANQPTRYDQAKAIELFLRSYPYTLSLPPPPADRDVADYFLFDLQTGYCDYYATSMVVLARAVGLPSRVVVGFVGGQYDEENNQYLVSEADAHTWVEVYFSGYGWIPFEPTAARDLIDEDALSLPLPPELELPPQTREAVEQREFPGVEVGLGVFVMLIMGVLIWNRADFARLKHMDTTNLSLEIYQRIFRYGRWLGLGHHKSDTLYEFNRKLKNAFNNLSNNPRREKRLADGESEINQLTKYAILANYSVKPLEEELAESILQIWKKLRIRMRYMIWISAWKPLAKKIFNREKKEAQLELITNGAADGKR
ncbi:MAG: transglutaminase domain-containing protein, partial [Anaerolineales bacterium]|nr:transglutaminase domain-containing protein [Anaerolineales bacterium]